MKLLFEIGMEEIPARFLEQALQDLKNNLTKYLKENRIKFDGIKTYGTPRRLVIFVNDIAEKQEGLNELNMGPSKTIAYADGVLTKAALGFLKGQGATEQDLEIVTTEKGEYIAVRKVSEGRETKNIIADILKNLVLNLSFPKSMKWSDKSLRFARPIEWFLAILDNEVVDFEIEGIKSSNKSKGHRFFGKEFEISNADDYFEKIKENNVIISLEERRAMIKDLIEKSLESGEKAAMTPALLDEVANLVEYPYPIIGSFDTEFLEVPQEVLIITMQVHQRYFPVLDKDGKLLPKFIVIRNGIEDSDNVRIGNEKVLSARLSDARFFYQEDLKIPFADNVEKLKNVVFQKDLGTIYNKMKRVEKLATYLADDLALENKEDILRTVNICKADLVSNMIGEKEYTKLQGFMGENYALKLGEKASVALGIKEHYYPRFQGDVLPTAMEGAITGIADRMDTLVGCFGVGIIPSGSKDPFALRRAALGIVNIILKLNLKISLIKLCEEALNNLENDKVLKRAKADVQKEVEEFLKQRLINIFVDLGHKKNIVMSVVAQDYDYPTETLEKIKIIEEYLQKDEFKKLLLAIKRVDNISKSGSKASVSEDLFENDYERELHQATLSLEKDVEEAVKNKNYREYFDNLVSITDKIDKYFENVVVMSKDEKIKENRIASLCNLTVLFNKMLDISLILED